MRRSVAWWVLALLLGQLPLSYADPVQQITVASENWTHYTQPDGEGLAWDILRLVYAPAGIELVIHSVPYTRASGLARRGEVDAFAGSYYYEVRQGIFYPQNHYDQDLVAALSLKEAPVPQIQTLQDYRLAWLHGYQFHRYLPTSRNYREISRTSNVLSMLQLRHADYYLDDLTELQQVLMQTTDRDNYRLTPLVKLPVYVGFADTPKGRELAEVFDERMKVLIADGSLRPVFERWKRAYPFD
ncbi:substrate-binding periplasmic protein [Pseudomonas sp. TTU2014-080ASC]|uniref:substrate-binding periplasmic protein n=1 Tax=Pseudomonas sp. TTU2014-080ASC TaxID=1729724 RepID=UPI00071832D6|nr:transporter substrate-binding domain-containing protein [Pseudomonas sp. TTU2014-080ASC]KRW57838.1 ABC transporter substrate-binding protein [Pseudomonas sp. TTU2014-080ASC]